MDSHPIHSATPERSEPRNNETIRTLCEILRLATEDVATTRNSLLELEHRIVQFAPRTPNECNALDAEIDRLSNEAIAALRRRDDAEEAIRRHYAPSRHQP